MTAPDGQGGHPATQWYPPHGWAPVAEPEPRPIPLPDGHPGTGSAWWLPLTRTPRRRALVMLAGMLALLGIYLSIITFYLASHLNDRYRQVPPGTTVTSMGTDFTLVSLTSVPAPLADSGGKTDPPAKNTSYAEAKVRLLPHPGTGLSYPCGAVKLIDIHQRSWESVYSSSLPPSQDSDFCHGLKTGVPTVATIVFAYPDSSIGAIAGVSVQTYTGAPLPVLVPAGP